MLINICFLATDVYHMKENNLIIDCKVRGNPRPKITWTKDNVPIEIDERTQQCETSEGVCELIINDPKPTDSGVYECTATNKVDSVALNHTVVITSALLNRRDSTLSSAKNVSGGGVIGTDGITEGLQSLSTRDKPAQPEKVFEEYTRRHLPPSAEEVAALTKNKLSFVTHLTNRVFQAGTKAKLACVVEGPDPMIKWFRVKGEEEIPIVYNAKYKNQSRDGICGIQILNCTAEDNGEYKLVVRNADCVITSSCKLDIVTPNTSADSSPTFTRNLKRKLFISLMFAYTKNLISLTDTYHLNSNELRLDTHVRGSPKPSIEWYKDGVKVEKGNPKYSSYSCADGTQELSVNYPRQMDSGKYVCKAYNRAGESTIVHALTFEGKEAHIADKRRRVFHADQKRLEQAKIDVRGGIPLPVVDQTEKSASKQGSKQGSGSGTPSGKNRSGDATPDQQLITIPAPETVSPPVVETYTPHGKHKHEKHERMGINFVTKLSDRVVMNGSKVKLTCYLEGVDPIIKWFKNDVQLAHNPKCKQTNKDGVLSLTFPAATEADSGCYHCVAKNNSGEISTKANLQVFPSPGSADAKPTFTRSLKDSFVTSCNEILLSCHVRGAPTPSVVWLKDGQACGPNEKYRVYYSKDGTCELNISYPGQRDLGKYVCRAENRAGACEISHVVQIKLKDPPGFPGTKSAAALVVESPTVDDDFDYDYDADADLPPDGRRKPAQPVATYERRYTRPPPPDPKANLFFSAFLSDRTVAVGARLKLTCFLEGPEPICRWFKDVKNRDPAQLVNNANCKFKYTDGLVTLELMRASLSDAGVYRVFAKNASNEVTTHCNVVVYEVVTEKTAHTKPIFPSSIKGKILYYCVFCLCVQKFGSSKCIEGMCLLSY